MKFLLLLPLLAGCTLTNIEGPNFHMHRLSFLQRIEWKRASISTNGNMTLSGYDTDGGVEAAAAITAAAVSAAIKGAKP